jgi:hypothetical protein
VIKEEQESNVQMVGQKLKLFTDEDFDPTEPADFNVEIIENPTMRNNMISVKYKIAGANRGGYIQTKCDSLEYTFVDDTTNKVLPVYFTPKGSMIMRTLGNKMCGAYASTNKGSDSSFA